MHLCASATLVLAGLGAALAYSADVPGDVQRLQIQRDQQQMELRLKMQQQQDRPLQPHDPSADARRRRLERDQQQRQQQLFHDQSRETIVAPSADLPGAAARREAERVQDGRSAAEQARRFETERQMESGRDR